MGLSVTETTWVLMTLPCCYPVLPVLDGPDSKGFCVDGDGDDGDDDGSDSDHVAVVVGKWPSWEEETHTKFPGKVMAFRFQLTLW